MHLISQTTFMVLVRRRLSWDLHHLSLVRQNVAVIFTLQFHYNGSEEVAPSFKSFCDILTCGGLYN